MKKLRCFVTRDFPSFICRDCLFLFSPNFVRTRWNFSLSWACAKVFRNRESLKSYQFDRNFVSRFDFVREVSLLVEEFLANLELGGARRVFCTYLHRCKFAARISLWTGNTSKALENSVGEWRYSVSVSTWTTYLSSRSKFVRVISMERSGLKFLERLFDTLVSLSPTTPEFILNGWKIMLRNCSRMFNLFPANPPLTVIFV